MGSTLLEAHRSFFGSATALLDSSGAVIASPYVYRTANGYVSLDLAVPSYNIEEQDWFTAPLAENAESGMSRFAGTDEDILRAFVLRAKSAV